jgi:hypothetical protein
MFFPTLEMLVHHIKSSYVLRLFMSCVALAVVFPPKLRQCNQITIAERNNAKNGRL